MDKVNEDLWVKIKENLIPLLLMISIPIFSVFYRILNNANREVHNLVTQFDLLIPFEEIFVVPYLLWYVFIFMVLSYLCLKDRDTYYTTLIAYLLTLAVSFLIYYIYQSTVPRPELQGNGILIKMVAFIYNIDQPYNCFPSIHVSTSYLMMKAVNISKVKNKFNSFLVNSIAGLIILSTLFIKQHFVLDVVAGVLVGNMLFDLAYHLQFADKISAWYRTLLPTKEVNIKVD